MNALAFDDDVTDASQVLRERLPERPSYGHQSTSIVNVIYPAPRPRIMVRTFLHGPTRKFVFKKTFVIRLEDSEHGVLASHPGLRCSGSGKTTREAISEFCEMFEVQWEALVDCALDELTAGARRVREEFLAIASPTPTE